MEIMSIVGAAIVAAILAVILRHTRPEYAVVLGLTSSVIFLLWAVGSIVPIIDLLKELVDKTNLTSEYQEILLKTLGISFITQMGSDCCKDAGENAIAQKVELCGKITIVALSLPLFQDILAVVSSMFSI